jgi:hypothetical protein
MARSQRIADSSGHSSLGGAFLEGNDIVLTWTQDLDRFGIAKILAYAKYGAVEAELTLGICLGECDVT